MNLRSVPSSQWPNHAFDPKRFAVWQGDGFLIQVFDEGGGIRRLSVIRDKRNKRGKWKDGISWESLQEIKDAIGYAAFDAVEIYPRMPDVVNVANMRHLWIVPYKIGFAWRAKA